MDKKLKQHQKFVSDEIEKIKASLKHPKWPVGADLIAKQVKKLDHYNNEMIRNFQHERFIHLIVTFFFAAILLISIALSFLVMYATTIDDYGVLCGLSMAITLILLVTEIFYIKHYYILENNTQKLYDLSRELFFINTNHK